MSKIAKKKIVKTKTRKPTPKPFRLYYSKAVLITSMGVLFFMLFLFVSESQRVQEQRSRAAAANCDASASELAISAEEQNLLQLINDYRTSMGIPTVKTSPTLMKSATWLSIDSNAHATSAHIDSLGRSISQRIITDCGYTGTIVGENVARGTGTTAQEIFDLWRTSTAGHNEEMLKPDTKVVGIAQSGLYWTMDTGNTDDSAMVPSGTVPSIPGPSFFPLAPCPTCTSPQVSPIPAPTATVPSTVVQPHVTNPVPSEDPLVSEAPSGAPIQPGQNGGGSIMDIIKLILQFIMQLLQQLFGGGNG